MKLLHFTNILATLLSFSSYAQNISSTPKYVGAIKIPNPAFLTSDISHNDVNNLTPVATNKLYVSSFHLFQKDFVHEIKNLDFLWQNQAPTLRRLTDWIVWPNETSIAPLEAVEEKTLVVPGGFLVPGKATGSITLLHLDSYTAKVVTPKKKGWWYHRVVWRDINGDGTLDILTARAKKEILGKGEGELVAFINPKQKWGTWQEIVLAQGPDVNFQVADLNNDGQEEIIATEFFNKQLTLYYSENGLLKKRVIDATLGSAFNVEVVDLNGDQKKDLLVTNHEPKNGSVFAYEVPENIVTGKFVRHTLLSGIPTRQRGINQASPGYAQAFYPSIHYQGKPYIVVGGDGSQRVHLLTPKTQHNNDWQYQASEPLEVRSTIGKIAVLDANNDGYADLFVPAYNKDTIYVLTFAP